MRRREFIALLAGAAVVPRAAGAQQPGRLPTIGFMGTTSRSAWTAWTAAFVQRLRELGWTEGSTVAIEYRWAEGITDRFDAIAAEFVRLKVDVIVTSGAGTPSVKQATSAIPIVFALAGDPLGGGLVASLSRPGGNVTGLSQLAADLAGKRLEVLREVLPGLRRLAILANLTDPQSVVELREVEAAAPAFGFAVIKPEVRRAEDFAPAVAASKGHADALYVCTGPLVNTNRASIGALANDARLPTMHSQRQYVDAGGLISYGPDIVDLFRRTGDYVDKILRGTKPGDLPVQQPTKFEMVINLKTAKVLGLEVSPMLLARADEVIE